MLKRIGALPLDYSLCDMTVTVYHREGLTRRVVSGAYYAPAQECHAQSGRERADTSFLLVLPGTLGTRLRPGDKVAPGEGPELTDWAALVPAAVPGLGVITSVTPRHFGGRLVHTEARG